MKLMYEREVNESNPVQVIEKFCWLPTHAVDEKLNTGKYLVWLERVWWNRAFKAWSIIEPGEHLARYK